MGPPPFFSGATAEKEKRECSAFKSRDLALTSKTSRRPGLRSGLAKPELRLDGPARCGLGENHDLCTLSVDFILL